MERVVEESRSPWKGSKKDDSMEGVDEISKSPLKGPIMIK